MKKFFPSIYQKTIHDVDYAQLKKKNVTCLIFDLDNTIALIDEKKVNKKTEELFQKLEKEFTIVIISNNTRKRVEPYAKELRCDFVSMAWKPFGHGFRKIKKKYHLKKEEMAMIGDQLMTDIFVGNRFTAHSILVEPLGKKDLKVTTFNRFLEKILFRYFEKKNWMKRGVYYEEKEIL